MESEAIIFAQSLDDKIKEILKIVEVAEQFSSNVFSVFKLIANSLPLKFEGNYISAKSLGIEFIFQNLKYLQEKIKNENSLITNFLITYKTENEKKQKSVYSTLERNYEILNKKIDEYIHIFRPIPMLLIPT